MKPRDRIELVEKSLKAYNTTYIYLYMPCISTVLCIYDVQCTQESQSVYMFGRTHCQWLNVVQTFVWMIWTRNNNGMKRKKKCFWLTLAFSKSEAFKIQRSSAGSFRLFFNPSVSLHIYLYLSVFLSAHLCAAPLIALLLWCIPKKILCVCVCK